MSLRVGYAVGRGTGNKAPNGPTRPSRRPNQYKMKLLTQSMVRPLVRRSMNGGSNGLVQDFRAISKRSVRFLKKLNAHLRK